MRSDAINLMNQQFGNLTVIDRNNINKKWICRCDCGEVREIRSYDLRAGKARMCLTCLNKEKAETKLNDLSGQKFGEWTVLRYLGNKKYLCRCSCGVEKEVGTGNLVQGASKSCAECANKNKIEDLSGKRFGTLTVLEYVGSSQWKVKCDCGFIEKAPASKLKTGIKKTCTKCFNENKKIDLTGKTFGEWMVLSYVGESRWKCRCSCGKISDVLGYNLRTKRTTSCGHNQQIDIKGKTFNEWTVLSYIAKGMWLCRCSCGVERPVHTYELRSGSAKSCGCKKWEYSRKALLEKYGEVGNLKSNSTRTQEQIETIENKELLRKFIENNFETKPTFIELGEELGLQASATLRYVHKHGLEDMVDISPSKSRQEKELYNFVKQFGFDVEQSNRTILKGQELDIYIPDKKLALEFNGTFWHSSVIKDKKYHQNKTIACAQQGIRLIHVYEYEWDDEFERIKIKSMLRDILTASKVIYGRNTEVGSIEKTEANTFINKFHLQGVARYSVGYGLYTKDKHELLGVIEFGKPRFSNEHEYELIRLCWRPGIRVVGGFEKLLAAFVQEYNPNNIVTYCDIGKFNGNSYVRVGFETSKSNLTTPNYVWVKPSIQTTLTRYQTMKHILLENGLGTPDQTEDEIMENMGFLKVYDSGNLKLTWNKKK